MQVFCMNANKCVYITLQRLGKESFINYTFFGSIINPHAHHLKKKRPHIVSAIKGSTSLCLWRNSVMRKMWVLLSRYRGNSLRVCFQNICHHALVIVCFFYLYNFWKVLLQTNDERRHSVCRYGQQRKSIIIIQ